MKKIYYILPLYMETIIHRKKVRRRFILKKTKKKFKAI